MELFNGIGAVLNAGGGPMLGIIAGLLYLLWQKDKHSVPKAVYERECARNERQADLLGDLSKSVAILVDRGGSR